MRNFRVVVPHGPGYLLFTAIDDAYERTVSRPADASPLGGVFRIFMSFGVQRPEYHAMARLDPAADATTHDVQMQVRRGRIVTGTIVDPNGQPLVGGLYLGRSEQHYVWRPVDGGKFIVTAYDPHVPARWRSSIESESFRVLTSCKAKSTATCRFGCSPGGR